MKSESGGDRGFLFQMERCTGCNACELACSTENELGWGRSWRQVFHLNEPREPGTPALHLSLACNHCDDAPCMKACPTLALRRSSETGAVLVDEERCMGCRYCSWACPYDALHFDHGRQVMTKCTLCHHRLREDRTPACVEACPTGALDFGALVGETGAPGLPETDAGPRIRFPEASREVRPLETTWSLPDDVVESFEAARPERSGHISLKAELPLWVFTSTVAALVGWALAALLGGPALHPVVFPLSAGAAGAVSFLHLGRKSRAWRALANLRRSRLSREIAVFGLFAASGVAASVVGAVRRGASAGWPGWLEGAAESLGLLAAMAGPLHWIAAGTGVLALWTMDRVYDPVRPPEARPVHSADTVLMGPAVAALLLGSLPAFLLLAVVKAGLWMRLGAPGSRSSGWSRGPAWAAGRLGLGLLVPAALLGAAPSWAPGWGLALFLAGELVDRAGFYDDLETSRPGCRAREAG